MSHQTFLFADLAGFTALTEQHGDETAADLAADYFQRVAELLPGFGGQRIKTIGDALMLRCEEAAAAVELGVCLVGDLGAQHGFPAVRVGMHTGTAVERGGDWFGATVNLAARVSSLAAGGEVLATAATKRAAGRPAEISFSSRGRRRLRNIRDEVELFEVSRLGAPRPALPLDPVCRMAVSPDRCAGSLRHEGVDYHFCSLECAGAFAADPGRYTSARL